MISTACSPICHTILSSLHVPKPPQSSLTSLINSFSLQFLATSSPHTSVTLSTFYNHSHPTHPSISSLVYLKHASNNLFSVEYSCLSAVLLPNSLQCLHVVNNPLYLIQCIKQIKTLFQFYHTTTPSKVSASLSISLNSIKKPDLTSSPNFSITSKLIHNAVMLWLSLLGPLKCYNQ